MNHIRFKVSEEKNTIEFLEIDKSDMINNLNELLAQLSQLKTKEIIIVDGYNDDHNDFFHCIPRNLPPNVTLIYTCDRAKKSVIERILGENEVWLKVELDNFDNQCSRKFIEAYLGKYNKKLDEKQMTLLLNKSMENKLPLWLSIVCNELRVFGEFSTINRKIEQIPLDLDLLVENIVERVNSDFRENIVKEA